MSFVVPIIDGDSKEDRKDLVSAMGRLIWNVRPDFYAAISECWIAGPNNATLRKKVDENNGKYEHGTISALPSEEKIEGLIIKGGTMDNKEHKIKFYQILRVRHNDESSKILELKNIGEDEEIAYDRMFNFTENNK